MLELRITLANRCKNGIAFLLAATVVWCVVLGIYLLPTDLVSQNVLTFYSTALLFPLAVLISKLIKAEWKTNDHPLGPLGLYLNIAQLIYFPILFFTFAKAPEFMIIFFAIITAAHLFPYGWLYNQKPYYILSPVLSICIALIGFFIIVDFIWVIPLTMIIGLFVLNSSLYISNLRTNRKIKSMPF